MIVWLIFADNTPPRVQTFTHPVVPMPSAQPPPAERLCGSLSVSAATPASFTRTPPPSNRPRRLRVDACRPSHLAPHTGDRLPRAWSNGGQTARPAGSLIMPSHIQRLVAGILHRRKISTASLNINAVRGIIDGSGHRNLFRAEQTQQRQCHDCQPNCHSFLPSMAYQDITFAPLRRTVEGAVKGLTVCASDGALNAYFTSFV